VNKIDPRQTYAAHVESLKQRFERDEALKAAVGGEFNAFGIVEREVLIQFGLEPDDYVVDVGCGSGRLAKPLSEFLEGRYLGIDVVPDLVDFARELVGRPDWRFEVTEGIAIPEADCRADMVAFFSVFTHLLHEQTYTYLAEARRVLKPGGTIVFSFHEFAVHDHWLVFEDSVASFSDAQPLNVFVSRDAIFAWARHLSLSVVDILDGDKRLIRLREPVTLDSGAVLETTASLGQSICVLSKRFPLYALSSDSHVAELQLHEWPGFYDPSVGAFRVEVAPTELEFAFGGPGKVPLAGDWDGSGPSRAGIYDPENGTFFLARRNAVCEASAVFGFGGPELTPIAGDWNGDGKDSVGVYDPATGAFHLTNENASGDAAASFTFGGPGLVPIAGDWDGDGKDTVGVYDPATAVFHLTNEHAGGHAAESFELGEPGLVPIAGDWDGDGVDSVGVYDPRVGKLLLRNNRLDGTVDALFAEVPAGLVPVVGRWVS
jgi:SAM-dependent methyltransferase